MSTPLRLLFGVDSRADAGRCGEPGTKVAVNGEPLVTGPALYTPHEGTRRLARTRSPGQAPPMLDCAYLASALRNCGSFSSLAASWRYRPS